MDSSSSSRPSTAPSVKNPFDDGYQVASATSVPPPSATVRPRMRSTLMPISLAHTTDQNVIKPLEVPKPWREKPNPRTKITYALVYGMILVGIAVSAIQCYLTYKNVLLDRQPLCIVMDEQFDRSEEEIFGPNGYFLREVDTSGAGNGQFDMTTSSSRNSFIKDGMLHIVPTLTADEIGQDKVFDNYIYNLTDCTFNITAPNNGFIISGDGTTAGSRKFDYNGYYKACGVASNASTGAVINPIQSARISTLLSAREGRGGSIKYGRVEVRAKMPKGDWLWPAIWMLPVDSKYGGWPRSGELDIVEARGNGLRYTARGSNYVQGTLHWGPSPELNSADKTFSWWTERRTSFADDFHTYALEWTDKFIRVYVDSRTRTLLTFKFKQPFFDLGDYPEVVSENGQQVPLANPWVNGTISAPFDQEFYLIMNVAVGSTNGWFPEGQGDKPWVNNAGSPMRDFARAQSLWYPTWPQDTNERGMIVDYVKMWKHC